MSHQNTLLIFQLHLQVIVYDHGQVVEDSSLTGRVAFRGTATMFPISAETSN